MATYIWIECENSETKTLFIDSPETRKSVEGFLTLFRLKNQSTNCELGRMVPASEEFEWQSLPNKKTKLEDLFQPKDIINIIDKKGAKHIKRYKKIVTAMVSKWVANKEDCAEECVEKIVMAGVFGDGARWLM